MDATIYVTQTIPLKHSLFTIKNEPNNLYLSENKWSGFLWYIPQSHPMPQFVYDYLIHYWEKHNSVIDYFLLDYIIKTFTVINTNFKEEIENLPINNPNLYFLSSPNGEKTFKKEMWDYICKNTIFFKNSWKKNYILQKDGQYTFCGKIFQE